MRRQASSLYDTPGHQLAGAASLSTDRGHGTVCAGNTSCARQICRSTPSSVNSRPTCSSSSSVPTRSLGAIVTEFEPCWRHIQMYRLNSTQLSSATMSYFFLFRCSLQPTGLIVRGIGNWMSSNVFKSLLLQFFLILTKLGTRDLCANTQKSVKHITFWRIFEILHLDLVSAATAAELRRPTGLTVSSSALN